MRNIIKIFALILLLASASSCQKFLNVIPQDSQVQETYFTSEEAVNNNTAALYTSFVWQGFHISFMWLAGDMMGGDMYYTYDQEGQFYYMTFNNGNTYLTNGWDGLYRVVSYCNNVINGMPESARENGVSEDVITRALAEARCIRGIAYYFLTEYWGNVPVITNNNISNDKIVCAPQSDVYEFMRRDLEFAKENLPTTAWQAGRCTKWTAEGYLAKLHLTMASHSNNANRAADFATAKSYAQDVINNSGLSLYSDLGNLFYPASNNNQESLFAIQCTSNGYGYGSARNIHHTRTALVNNGTAYGTGKGPTLSLQECLNEEAKDMRRANTFMRNGDHYNNLGGGGYTYSNYTPKEGSNTTEGAVEQPNEVLANIRKYVIGDNSDCGGLSGNTGQDAGGNIYHLRLADIYLVYVDACIAAGTSTSDALALDVYSRVRSRAGLETSASEITLPMLIKERRKEFAFESINIFDAKRLYYRDHSEGLEYLNSMHRERTYVPSSEKTDLEVLNGEGVYHGGSALSSPTTDPDHTSIFYYVANPVPVVFTEANMLLPVPASTITKTPNIGNVEPYNFE
jgi:hypothetical protein